MRQLLGVRYCRYHNFLRVLYVLRLRGNSTMILAVSADLPIDTLAQQA